MGIAVEEVAEDTRECTPKKTPTPLHNNLLSPHDLILQAGHGADEEVEVACLVIFMRVRSALVADGAQGKGSHDSEILEH